MSAELLESLRQQHDRSVDATRRNRLRVRARRVAKRLGVTPQWCMQQRVLSPPATTMQDLQALEVEYRDPSTTARRKADIRKIVIGACQRLRIDRPVWSLASKRVTNVPGPKPNVTMAPRRVADDTPTGVVPVISSPLRAWRSQECGRVVRVTAAGVELIPALPTERSRAFPDVAAAEAWIARRSRAA